MIPCRMSGTSRRGQSTSRISRALSGFALVLAVSALGGAARAQPSSSDTAGAATAFDRGTAAYLAHDYARAAQWFETAYGLAPSSAALVQAIRANNRAGNALRAGSLALRVPALYADDAAAMRSATEAIDTATPLFLRVDVTCTSECDLEIDGALASFTSVFVEPGRDHAVRATFETGAVDATVNGAAGETRALSFDAPEASAVVVVDDDDDDDGGASTTPPPSSGGGISPAFFATGLVLTAIAGGVLVGGTVWAYDGVPAYEMMPTPAGLADGQTRETLVNAMIGVTAGLAVTTVILAIVTDWDGDPAPASTESSESPSSVEVSASIGVGPDGASGVLRGTF